MATTVRIPVPDSTDDDMDSPKISNFEVSASYNWLDEYTPTILVPGIPPVWNPPVIAPSLEPDSGPRYVDQNTDRNPVSPLAAILRAVQTSQPDFDFASVDIITDRRPIRKLYSFVTGDWNSFKFGVTILGNTALFTRMENRTREEQMSHNHKEYRQAFEEAYLKIPVSAKDSTSHHRVVQYVFGGMTFLVRSAVDAYLPDRAEELKPESNDKPTDPEALTKFAKAISLDEPRPSFQSLRAASVTVISGGRQIPHAATLELSTRSTWMQKGDLRANKMPDLWISQTANFLEAYHKPEQSIGYTPSGSRGMWRGASRHQPAKAQPRSTKFTEIKVESLTDELVAWETANVETLGKLALVIKKVVEAAEQLQGTCIVSLDENEGALEVSRARKGDVPGLSNELQDLFL